MGEGGGVSGLEFNVNNYVWVKLTADGRRWHRDWHGRHYGDILPYHPPEEDADGWSKWQLWSLMQDFGEGIHLGGRVPFETTIRLEPPLPTDPSQE